MDSDHHSVGHALRVRLKRGYCDLAQDRVTYDCWVVNLIDFDIDITSLSVISEHRVTCNWTPAIIWGLLPANDQVISSGAFINPKRLGHSRRNITSIERERSWWLWLSIEVWGNNSKSILVTRDDSRMGELACWWLIMPIKYRDKVNRPIVCHLKFVTSNRNRGFCDWVPAYSQLSFTRKLR